ncbi:MAG: NAD(P)H-dependent oxidoreductase [Chthoniobacteraceae bacterium]
MTTSTELLEALNWRYATKQFDPTKKISAGDWAALEEALVLTPSSFGLQPWKFLVLTNAELREKLVGFSWNQRQVADASHFVIFAGKTTLGKEEIEHYLQRIAEVRGTPIEALAPFRGMLEGSLLNGPLSSIVAEWAARQVYIALGNLMTAAAMLKIDTCPMEGFEPAKYDEVLNLPAQGLRAVVACAVGYRSENDKYAGLAKVRYPKAEVVEII